MINVGSVINLEAFETRDRSLERVEYGKVLQWDQVELFSKRIVASGRRKGEETRFYDESADP